MKEQNHHSYKIKGQKELKTVSRSVGLIVLRGTEVVTVTPEKPTGTQYVYIAPPKGKKGTKDGKRGFYILLKWASRSLGNAQSRHVEG